MQETIKSREINKRKGKLNMNKVDKVNFTNKTAETLVPVHTHTHL